MRLYLILTILLLVLFSFTSVGCIGFEIDSRTLEDEIQDSKDMAVDQNHEPSEDYFAKEEVVAEKDGEEEAAISEEGCYTFNKLVTYTGNLPEGAKVILIVDFKTDEVTGSINFTQDTYATINDGKMDPDTLEITASYSGIIKSKENKEVLFNGTITGKIVDDLSSFNGIMLSDAEDAEAIGFAANKYYRTGPCSL